MSEKCPKCGANYRKHGIWGGKRTAIFKCDTESKPDYDLFDEGKNCLRRQLAAAKLEIAKWQAAHSDTMNRLQDEGERLAAALAVIEKLPKTADGVVMVPLEHYFAECRDRWNYDGEYTLHEVIWWQGGGEDCFNPEYTLVDNSEQWEFFSVRDVFSTREAQAEGKAAKAIEAADAAAKETP